MEEKNPFLSVVVPIHNIDKYVDACINSITKQTFKDMEIILIDDGSTDSSGLICDKWKEQDNRIIVVHKKQCMGLANARKTGVRLARGKYVTFVDGDDWLDGNLYQSLVIVINKYPVDVICFGITVQTKEHGMYIEECLVKKGLYITKEERGYLYQNMFCCDEGFSQKISPSLCSKIYRQDIIKKNIEYVDDRITLGEDAACSYICLLESQRIYVSDVAGYCYRYVPASMTKRYDAHYYERVHIFSNCVDCIVKEKKLKVQKQYDLYKLYLYYRNLRKDLCNWKEYKKLKRAVCSKEFQNIFKTVDVRKIQDSSYNKIQYFLLRHKQVFLAVMFAKLKKFIKHM